MLIPPIAEMPLLKIVLVSHCGILAGQDPCNRMRVIQAAYICTLQQQQSCASPSTLCCCTLSRHQSCTKLLRGFDPLSLSWSLQREATRPNSTRPSPGATPARTLTASYLS